MRVDALCTRLCAVRNLSTEERRKVVDELELAVEEMGDFLEGNAERTVGLAEPIKRRKGEPEAGTHA